MAVKFVFDDDDNLRSCYNFLNAFPVPKIIPNPGNLALLYGYDFASKTCVSPVSKRTLNIHLTDTIQSTNVDFFYMSL